MRQLDLLQKAEELVRSGDTAAALAALSDLRHSIDVGYRDPLTGLGRRETLAERRSGASVGVLFVDLDGLKQINDSYGHAAGDAFIARAAKALHGTLRQKDHAMRWGGDEFVLVLDGVQDGFALEVAAERARTALKRANLHASIGCAVQYEGEVLVSTIERADSSMYLEKKHHHLEHKPEPSLSR